MLDWLSHRRFRDLLVIFGCIAGIFICIYFIATQSSRTRAEEERLGIISLDLRSEPAEAEVFLDWVPKGRTPMRLNGVRVGGLLVVTKDGYQAHARLLSHRESNSALDLNLSPEDRHPQERLLLLISDNATNDFYSSLRGQLVAQGFTIIGQEEAKEFNQEAKKAGGISHQGFRSWARTRFDTDLLVMARAHQSSQELSGQEFGYPGIREAVKGIVGSKVSVELEVFDLRSGDHLTAVSGKGEEFALDRAESVQKALARAITEVSEKLRQQLRG